MKGTPTFDNPPAVPTCRQRRIVAFPALPRREPPASNARSNSQVPLLSAQEVLHRTLFASLYLLVRLCGDCRIAAGVRLGGRKDEAVEGGEGVRSRDLSRPCKT